MCSPSTCGLPTWPFFALAWLGDVSAVLLIAIRTYRLIMQPEADAAKLSSSRSNERRTMSTDAVAIIGFVALFALMLLRVPVGMAMGLVGVSGFGYLVNGTAALKLVGHTTMRTVTDYTFGVIPMFLLMGTFVSNSGMSRELFTHRQRFRRPSARRARLCHGRRLRRLSPRSAARRSRPRRPSPPSPIRKCGVTATRRVLRPA